ncbi:MAG: FimV/HubP family polar landmark protein, partial [Thiogranum sp.]
LSFDANASVNEDQPDNAEVTPSDASADAGSEQPEASEPEFKVAADSGESDAIDLDNGLDFDLDGFELGNEAETEAELEGDGELADLDEVSTKLDLARAYIDMGDPDGAKNILDEVMDEGNDEQKDEAREIMTQMS